MEISRKQSEMITVVIDCSTFLSGAFYPFGNPRRILKLWLNRKIEAAVTPEIIEEYERKIEPLAVKMKLDSRAGKYYLGLVKAEAIIVRETSLDSSVCRDSNDVKYLEAAAAAEADYLIASDKDLLILKRFWETKIVSPAAFLKCARLGG